MEPEEIDVSKITYYNADGTVQSSGSDSGNNSGSGFDWSKVFGFVTDLFGKAFPNGVTGNNNNYPTITTLPNGNTNVQLAGQNNLIIYALIGAVLFMFFTGQQAIKPAKKR